MTLTSTAISNLTNISCTVTGLGDPPARSGEKDISCQRVMFSELPMATFSQDNVTDKTFYPSGLTRALFFYPVASLGLDTPSFLTGNTWDIIGKTSCGFLSGNKTVMPRMVFATKYLAANGLNSVTGATTDDISQQVSVISGGSDGNGDYKTAFNWDIPASGTSVSAEDSDNAGTSATQVPYNTSKVLKNYGIRTSPSQKQEFSYINMGNAKDETLDQSSFFIRRYILDDTNKKQQPGSNCDQSSFHLPLVGRGTPSGSATGGQGYAGGAACAIVLGFHSTTPTFHDPTKELVPPQVNIQMGQITLLVTDGDKIVAQMVNPQQGSLAHAEGSLLPGQLLSQDIPKPLPLLVYPIWNGIVCSSGLQDSSNLVDAGFAVVNNPNINMNDYLTPTFDEFDVNNPTSIQVNYTGKAQVDWGTQVILNWYSLGAFAYVPAFFVPSCKFSVYIKDRCSIEKSEYQSNAITYVHEAYPIFSVNGSNYMMDGMTAEGDSNFVITSKNPIIASVVYTNADEGYSYYRFDFNMFTQDKMWERRGMELWGFIHRTITTSTQNQVLANNGTFNLNVGAGAAVEALGGNWISYATSISISRTLDGTTGSISLDKYAMMVQDDIPEQSIGGIILEMHGGNTNQREGSGETVMVPGKVFSGIAMEITDNVAEGGDSLSINLYGLEKKLEEIKLINAPFWDGDKISVAAAWLGEYGGVDISFAFGDGTLSLPRSTSFEAPAVNFQMGTTVLEALKTIGEMTNQSFIIQRDGVGYYYKRNDLGVPLQAYSGNLHVYTSTNVISMDVQPFFGNFYNTVMTVGLLNESPSMEKEPPLFPGVRFNTLKTDPPLPWSKIMVDGVQGYLDNDKLNDIHARNLKLFRHYISTGSITVPGNSSIDLFDRIQIDDKEFYIHGVTQNIDLASGVWTTGLQVAKTPNV